MTPEDIVVLYVVYRSMIDRCTNTRNKSYKDYGGRGISVCERWSESFNQFVADVGLRPSPDHQIDRRDNDGNYEPSNVRWATRVEQSYNRRSNRIIEFQGRRQALTLWAREYGLERLTLKRRLDVLGWTVERALTTPPTFDGKVRPHEVLVTACGRTERLSVWARELGVVPAAIASRLKAGWQPERAVTEPAPERPNAKLALAAAQAIRAAYPGKSSTMLADEYAVSKKTILNIIHGRTFRDDPALET